MKFEKAIKLKLNDNERSALSSTITLLKYICTNVTLEFECQCCPMFIDNVCKCNSTINNLQHLLDSSLTDVDCPETSSSYESIGLYSTDVKSLN